MENKRIIQAINWILGLSCIVLFFLILFSDLTTFASQNPNITPQVWILDYDLYDLAWGTEGNAKLISAIIGLVGMGWFFCLLIMFYHIKKQKKNNFYATIIFFSVFYLFLARTMEVIYIISQSDLSGILNAMTQFYIPFDLLAFSFFMIFSVQVFLAEEIQRNERWSYLSLTVAGVSVLLGVFGALAEWNLPIDQNIFLIFTIGCSGLNLIIAFILTTKIFKTRKKLTEKKAAFLFIGLLYICFIIASILLVGTLAIKGLSHTLSYQIRAIKNIVYLGVGFYYYTGIIVPGKTPK